MQKMLRNALFAGVAGGAVLVAVSQAQAGGFINQSQSSVFNGMAYAGYAAPGSSSLATMFLNPATMAWVNQITIDSNYSLVMPVTKINGLGGVSPAPGVFVPAFGAGTSGDQAQDAVVPATYAAIPISRSVVMGVSINAPYGNATKPGMPWVGQLNSMTTKVRSINITPQIAFRITDNFSIGFGLQLQRMDAKFLSALQPFPNPTPLAAGFKGSGFSAGVTAGIAFTPWAGTHIGIGYRSRIDQDLEGHYIASPGSPLFPLNASSIRGTLKLPDRLNISLRQNVTAKLDVLASAEWQGWGRIGTARLTGPLVLLAPIGLRSIPLEYKDGWFFALGGEYKFDPKLTLRAGVAYELAPIDDRTRTTRLPDNNRFWTSVGATYQWSDRLAINVSYSRVWVKNADIALVNGHPAFSGPPVNAAFVGSARSHVDIVSLGITSRWGAAAPAVVAKY